MLILLTNQIAGDNMGLSLGEVVSMAARARIWNA